jgi:hypothetical protein
MILEKASQFNVSLVSRAIPSGKMAELINVVEAGNARDIDAMIDKLAKSAPGDDKP